jgi:alpha-beta hydrolase superfamily lysophospholipase
VARAKEYSFLLYAASIAVAYAVVHDQVTATISPEYFIYGKGLDASLLRLHVAWLAVRAGLPVGLLGGTALLVANNPRRSGIPPQLGYRPLVALACVPLATAALLAGAFGAVNASAQFGTATARELGVPDYRTWRFVIVWGVHAGSYAGALLGIAGVALAVARRRGRLLPGRRWTSRLSFARGRPALRGAASLLLVYVLVCVAARLGYRTLLYPAPPDPPFAPSRAATILTLRAEDGAVTVAAQFPPPEPDARTVVIFHGNGETIGGRLQLAEDLHARGLGVVLAEYRGYGLARGSGAPDEAGLYRDAAAVLDELQRQGIGPRRVALLGISLGTGVAVEMAARGRGTALILVSPYTSIPAMAARVLPFLPTGWLCPDRFDTAAKAPALRIPTLVIHGNADEVVPFAMGRQVAASIPGAVLREVPGGHHNDLFLMDRAELEGAIADAAKR